MIKKILVYFNFLLITIGVNVLLFLRLGIFDKSKTLYFGFNIWSRDVRIGREVIGDGKTAVLAVLICSKNLFKFGVLAVVAVGLRFGFVGLGWVVTTTFRVLFFFFVVVIFYFT